MVLLAITGTGVKILLFILSLSILVVLHEMGHFLPAKYFGIRVSRFYLFFDFLFPFSKVLNFSLFKKKIGDTEYGIGWFPFGGYVQIAGMVDETQSEEDLDKVPAAEQFRYKPAWQRLIIMVGGVTVNLVLAMVIYTGLLWAYGEKFLPVQSMTNGIAVTDSIGYEIGLQNGDKLVSLDGKKIRLFDDFQKELIFNEAKSITVNRNGVDTTLPIKAGTIAKILKAQTGLIMPRYDNRVGDFGKNSMAKKAGIQVNDRIVEINGQPVEFFDEIARALTPDSVLPVNVKVLREGKYVSFAFKTDEKGKLGVGGYTREFGRPNLSKYFEMDVTEYSFFPAIKRGIGKTFENLGNYIVGIKKLFTSPEVKLKDSLGGFYSMGKIFPSEFDWESFWTLTAFISVVLAFMNILPIPMLDGGYVLFLFYEILVGKPLPEKVQNVAQTVGMFFILALLLFANGSDVPRIIRDIKEGMGK